MASTLRALCNCLEIASARYATGPPVSSCCRAVRRCRASAAPDELAEFAGRDGAVLLDVRSAREVQQARHPLALHIPADAVPERCALWLP